MKRDEQIKFIEGAERRLRERLEKRKDNAVLQAQMSKYDNVRDVIKVARSA